MKQDSLKRQITNIILFVCVFYAIQIVAVAAVAVADGIMHGFPEGSLADSIAMTGEKAAWATVVSSIVTILLFHFLHWSPYTRMTGVDRPGLTLFWVALFTLGTLEPFQWMEEQMPFQLPDSFAQLFNSMMRQPLGFLAIGILGPIAEEMVFRGGVLRQLLVIFRNRSPWVAISVSALIFGAVHGNLPQFIHATMLGLIIGWLYVRTGSILPGLVLHWVNNAMAYILFQLMPQMADGKLVDLFGGDTTRMWLSLACSLCILLASWLQLLIRMNAGKGK